MMLLSFGTAFAAPAAMEAKAHIGLEDIA